MCLREKLLRLSVTWHKYHESHSQDECLHSTYCTAHLLGWGSALTDMERSVFLRTT